MSVMKSDQKISKRLSFVLRHKPESVGLQLDPQGWVPVMELLDALGAHGMRFSRAKLERIVKENDKKRFTFSADGKRIRAAQGHSVEIDLDLREATPPTHLYHGTSEKFLASISEQGLLPGGRHHVHLSQTRATAFNVGSRRGKPVVLEVQAKQMKTDGYTFYLSDNGVWLTDTVPAAYLTKLS